MKRIKLKFPIKLILRILFVTSGFILILLSTIRKGIDDYKNSFNHLESG